MIENNQCFCFLKSGIDVEFGGRGVDLKELFYKKDLFIWLGAIQDGVLMQLLYGWYI